MQDYDAGLRFDRIAVRAQNPGDIFARSEGPGFRTRAGENAVRQFGCVVWPEELGDLAAAAEGAPAAGGVGRGWLHVAIFFERASADAVAEVYRALGYGAEQRFARRLGYRVYAGPLDAAGLAGAAEVARRLGLDASYPVRRPQARQ